jgi:organic radical activating enzyme
MRAESIKSNNRVKPLKYGLHDTPHATIEPNHTCNIRCRSCYNLYKDQVKSLNEVKKEIDHICRIRNLQTITVLGGEPTLHPDLSEIVTYIKSKRLICQVLTNGIVFLEDERDRLLDKLAQAGVDKILLHIDIGQTHIHSDIEGVREILFSKMESKGIFFSLSVTIYSDYTRMLPGLVKKYSRYRFFDGILAILARNPLPPKTQNPQLLDEYRSISEDLQIEPIAFIPSNLDDYSVSWLIYLYYINAHTGKTFAISPVLNRVFRKLYRTVKRHHLFVIKINNTFFKVFTFITLLLEAMTHPGRIKDLLILLKGASGLRTIRFHYIAIQTPPEFNEQEKCLQICYHCPDATIRNGKLTPVCIADQLNPRNGAENFTFPESYYQAVYSHLGG